MNINRQIVQHLEKLATHGPKAAEAVLLSPPDHGKYLVGTTVNGPSPLHVSLILQDYDRFSAALRRMSVSFGPSPAESITATGLSHWAEKAAQKLSYLEEPLVVLEMALAEGVAQLRSANPTFDEANEARHYWEVVLSLEPQPAATLTRYRWSPELAEREVVVYPVAFATLGRLAQDLADSMVQAAA